MGDTICIEGVSSKDQPVPEVQFTKEGKLFKAPKRYKRLDEKFNYLIVTRSDITCSFSVLSQYMSYPTVSLWVAVKQILCYLKRALGREILYKNHGLA